MSSPSDAEVARTRICHSTNDHRSDQGYIRTRLRRTRWVHITHHVSDTYPDDPPVKFYGNAPADGHARGSFTAKRSGNLGADNPAQMPDARGGRHRRRGWQLEGSDRRRRRVRLPRRRGHQTWRAAGRRGSASEPRKRLFFTSSTQLPATWDCVNYDTKRWSDAMANSRRHHKSALVAGAMAVSATGLFTAAATCAGVATCPARAGRLPGVGLQRHHRFEAGNRGKHGLQRRTRRSTGRPSGPTPSGTRDKGRVTGNIDSNGQVNVTWLDETHTIDFTGQVGPDGIAQRHPARR